MVAPRPVASTLVLTLALLLVAPIFAPWTAAAQEQTPGPMVVVAEGADTSLLVYHQITALDRDYAFGVPVLSADGTRAVFADAPGSGDPAIPNRIYVVAADGAGLAEVDAYTPLCFCGAEMDISADGATVVSTDSVRLRLAGAGGARDLLVLAGNELSSVRLTAAGDRVSFLLARDTQVRDAPDVLQRGIYVVGADGGGLRQIVGPDQIAGLLGIAPDAVQMLRLQTGALDVSADGARLVFGAYVGAQQAVFSVDEAGGDLRQVGEPVVSVQHVAISGDGATVAYDVVPPDSPGGDNEVSVVPYGGGEPRLLARRTSSGSAEPMQLSGDGSRLLLSPSSLLIETATGATRQLAVATPGVGGHEAVLSDGLTWATMDEDAGRFLYAMRTIRCADCVNLPKQLATLDLDPTDLGAAPVVAEPSVEPAEIPLDYQSAATATAEVTATGTLLGVGLVALRDGRYDVNVGRGAILHDDGQAGDAAANDGVFSNDAVVHLGAEAREDDTGPRTLRIQAEVEAGDGRRHATAIEFGPLTVVAGP